MKTSFKFTRKILAIWLLTLALACSKDDSSIEAVAIDPCKENPCSNPDLCPDSCSGQTEGSITKDDLTPSGDLTETENGYVVDGALAIETETEGTVVFAEANLEVEFNEDGSLKNISGTTEIPSPSNYFEFENPVQADLGFFSGKFLNENRNFEIKLKDDRSYFVFAIAVALELKVGANDDPDATKPIAISPPVGGHITLIADYTDPMFFYSLGGDALGGNGSNGNNGSDGDNNDQDNDGDGEVLGVSFGASLGAHLRYEPILPVENVVSFDAKTVTGGTFSFWKVLEVSGMYYQNKGFDVNFNLKEPMESEIGYGYRAGINGSMEFSASIKDIVSFGFPIGRGSAAIVAEASTADGINARAFVNGLVDPDLSWWPEFIPVKPAGRLNAYGYIEETGAFDMGLSGALGLEMPSGTQGLQGSVRLTQNEFTMTGEVISGDEIWGATAVFTKEETRCITTPPDNFAEGIAETVTEQIDAAIATTQQAYDDLEKANERYELELSLRGLRAALPGIMDRANREIDNAVAAGIKSGRDQANKILADYGRVLCSDNISSKVNGLVKPYKDALTRIKNAVDATNDNAQTRTELEAALLHLASLDKINKSVTVSITSGTKLLGCGKLVSRTDTRTIKITRTVLSADHVSQLRTAASYVKYIAEADGLRFDAQVIVDQLPTLEELENLKSNVEACVKELTEGIGDVGFVLNHNTGEFSFFIVINGEEQQVDDFNIFSADQVIETARFETLGCNGDEALKTLMQKSK